MVTEWGLVRTEEWHVWSPGDESPSPEMFKHPLSKNEHDSKTLVVLFGRLKINYNLEEKKSFPLRSIYTAF